MKAVKFIAVLLSAGILALAFTTPCFAQGSFGQKLGPQSSQASGDLAKNKQESKESVKQTPPASFGVKLGPQSSQPSGDLATNSGGAQSTEPAAGRGGM